MIRNLIGSFRASRPRTFVGACFPAVLTVVALFATFPAPSRAATIALDLTSSLQIQRSLIAKLAFDL